MKATINLAFTILAMLIWSHSSAYGQEHIIFENNLTIIPDGIIANADDNIGHPKRVIASLTNSPKSDAPISLTYKWSKSEYYNKASENDEWQFDYSTNRDFNNIGLLTKSWEEGQDWTKENNYDLYFYDEQNRNIRIEHYWEGDEGLAMQGYHTIEYLNDFPDIVSSVIYYTREVEWDQKTNDWKYVWEILSGEKKDYTISKKVANHYEKKVDYTYNSDTDQWDVSGYKYDYVVNPKGFITETLVYKATKEEEYKWPLILHVKNLINDNGVVFRSERFNYQGSTPYIARWSNIQWDRHDGSIPISGYAVRGSNRMKSAKIEYLLVSDPSTEYIPSRTFSSEYQNNESFHYIISDNMGNKLIDNSYYREVNYSLQELWQGADYQMQYYDIDDHNWVTYDHYVQKHFYEGDNVITERDWHRYTYNEYYLNTNECTLSEHYEYDALTNTEPYRRSRSVYSGFKEYSSSINSISVDENNNNTPTYYNIQGMLICNPKTGQLLIRKVGNRTDKIIYK